MKLLHPDSAFAEMHEAVAKRSNFLHGHLADRSQREAITVPFKPSRNGHVSLNGIPVSQEASSIQGWAGVLVVLEARPATSMQFSHWKGIGLDSPTMLVELQQLENVEPVFEKVQGLRP